ncbi:uncharacterized protein MELLADRAFT_102721 [Melampsora larici-populina 98AG31]|uniref:Uncharacterized protein n=1 Tax=Melampsora larici-populina (strain 98AG31 / pathotype 3-4-7) TaxID=747676 RepID=F4R961_MELLP|nr:uncharacterized protein MELLADRAFT_102721 [Melampsora larici-populina 98AG31]EGG11208.1 hypothetical protein MELLADRAFT_102721 [Melampsora larici-populina 98AG31]
MLVDEFPPRYLVKTVDGLVTVIRIHRMSSFTRSGTYQNQSRSSSYYSRWKSLTLEVEPTIGLELHVQLASSSIFSSEFVMVRIIEVIISQLLAFEGIRPDEGFGRDVRCQCSITFLLSCLGFDPGMAKLYALEILSLASDSDSSCPFN